MTSGWGPSPISPDPAVPAGVLWVSHSSIRKPLVMSCPGETARREVTQTPGISAAFLPHKCQERFLHLWRAPGPWMLQVAIHSCVHCATHSTSSHACWTVSTTSVLAAYVVGLLMAACPVHCASKCPNPREGEVGPGPGREPRLEQSAVINGIPRTAPNPCSLVKSD